MTHKYAKPTNLPIYLPFRHNYIFRRKGSLVTCCSAYKHRFRCGCGQLYEQRLHVETGEAFARWLSSELGMSLSRRQLGDVTGHQTDNCLEFVVVVCPLLILQSTNASIEADVTSFVRHARWSGHQSDERPVVKLRCVSFVARSVGRSRRRRRSSSAGTVVYTCTTYTYTLLRSASSQ